ncbi:MAG TPA: right-handed parallel beta-helix repeat-containing protein [Myxococcota bacterium]|nr:right-handed parallel beta-helix repeat-containing protein [Myxococcota bacterium]HQK51954.1 right-handed parallel beta-helix repeat-containing protein [Myxococcota bacterium]
MGDHRRSATILLTLSLVAAPAWPQTSNLQKAARSLYEKGRARYDAGDFQAAQELFDQSLRLYATPHARLYRSASLARTGNCPLALEGLATFSVTDLPPKAREKGSRLREEVLRLCPAASQEPPPQVPAAEASPAPGSTAGEAAPKEPVSQATPALPEVTRGAPEATAQGPEAASPEPPATSRNPGRPRGSATEFQVARDGGDFPDLAQAVAQAPDGARIVLGPGRHRLEHPLRITRPVHIVGAGPDQTTLVCDGEDFVLRFEGSGPFALSDLAVEHDGVRTAAVIQVLSGEVDFRRILATGAIRHPATRRGGQGLLVGGDARGQVLSSVFRRNALHGIQVTGKAVLRIEACQCLENGQTGISWFESASGSARDNVMEKNDRYGLAVVPPARPQISGNVCRENRRGGLYLEEPLPLGPGNDCPLFQPRRPGK